MGRFTWTGNDGFLIGCRQVDVERRPSTGRAMTLELYGASNNQITSAVPMGQVGLEWQAVGFRPNNGAGISDMLMRTGNVGACDITNARLQAQWAESGSNGRSPASSPIRRDQRLARADIRL